MNFCFKISHCLLFYCILGRSSVAEDGWTPTSKSNKGSYSVVDPSKLKLTKVR